MRTRLSCLVALSLAMGGCSTTIVMAANPGPSPEQLDRINDMGARQIGRVTAGGATFAAPRLSMTPTSLVVGPDASPVDTIPLADLQTIEFKSHGRGGLEGGGIGLVAAALGSAAVLAFGSGGSLRNDADTAFLVVGVVFGIYTVPLGMLVGSVRGHRTIIRIGPGG